MENVIIDELTKKKLSTWKRLFIYLFDTLCIIITILLLFFTLGELLIKTIANDSIQTINNIYNTECNKNDYQIEKGFSGIYQLDMDSFIDTWMKNNSEKSYTDAMEAYNNAYYDIDSKIVEYDGYIEAYKKYTSTYYTTLLFSFFISSFFFLLLIPLCNKKKKTIANYITKTSYAHDKTNIIASNKVLFQRFFCVFAIELSLAYIAMQLISLAFVAIVSIITISFSKKKKAIHDFLVFAHVEKDEFTYTA